LLTIDVTDEGEFVLLLDEFVFLEDEVVAGVTDFEVGVILGFALCDVFDE
jgi:hypothetical protein